MVPLQRCLIHGTLSSRGIYREPSVKIPRKCDDRQEEKEKLVWEERSKDMRGRITIDKEF